MSSADERVAANVAQWTLTNAEYTDEQAERTWRRDDLVWGVFGIPDQWIGDVDGLDVVELGCGTAFEGARLARKGARVVGVDPTPAQLATARRMMELVGPEFPLVEAPAENVPLPDDSFDLAVSGYGASLWADPRGWLPEAARLLRPGGRLLFLTVSPLAHLCMPDTDDVPITNKLQRPQFAPWEVEWEGYQGVEFHLSHADWIRVLRDSGFVIDALHELQAPEGARRHEYYNVIAPTWARRWPGEDIWDVHLYERRLDGARKGAEVPALPAPERVNMNEVDSIAANIEEWTETNAQFTDANAKRAWDHEGILWGVFSIPEEQVGALPDVNGLDVVELGCGTAYFGSWLARRGARVTGVDPTPAQLATARRMMQETGLEFPLVEAPAEDVPLPDASFDLAVSEYGASLWADPYKWVPEASRLLRPGGLLVFLLNGTLVYLCAPPAEEETVGTTLLRDQFGMYRIRWDGATGIEYHLSHSDWIKVMRDNGFEIEALHELRPHPEAVDPTYYDYVTVEWAQKWPAEEIWVARKL